MLVERVIVPAPPVLETTMRVVVESVDPGLLDSFFPTPGRNAECPCGSGDKYKRCCLPSDQDAWRVVALKTRQADAACAMLRMIPSRYPAYDPEAVGVEDDE